MVRGPLGQQKKEIAERLTALLVEVGKASGEHVWIRFVDSPKSEWAVGGVIQGAGEQGLGPPD